MNSVGMLDTHANQTVTENADIAFKTTGDKCLDFFTKITRNAPLNTYIESFIEAWNENQNTTFQILMNMRDVRNGKGEKEIPIVIIFCLKNYLSYDAIARNIYIDILRKLIEYGCWKDLLKIADLTLRFKLSESKTTKFDEKYYPELKMFAEQLLKDKTLVEGSSGSMTRFGISLCAKWAPTENTYYDNHPRFFTKHLAKIMGMSLKAYRQMITMIRKHLNVIEMLMSTQQFDKIDFSHVPSVAMLKLKKAFNRDTNSNNVESSVRCKLHKSYEEYLKKLTKGETKVNTKGIQPHELVGSYLRGDKMDDLTEAQWKEIVNNITKEGSFEKVTAIVDVSGSMSGTPMQVSIALGILIAECTKEPYKGKVLTFSTQPTWHNVVGDSLREKVMCLQNAEWGGSTNLRAVFDLILQDAIKDDICPEQMVDTLFIFTDMQFNTADKDWESSFEYAKNKYELLGYKLPKIICWNLRTSVSNSTPVTQHETGFAMLSGFSSELLKCVLSFDDFSPIVMMHHVLESYTVPQSLLNHELCISPISEQEKNTIQKIVVDSRIKPSWRKKVSNE
jgi:hypothetical protein